MIKPKKNFKFQSQKIKMQPKLGTIHNTKRNATKLNPMLKNQIKD
jgi:hypothetical protein